MDASLESKSSLEKEKAVTCCDELQFIAITKQEQK